MTTLEELKEELPAVINIGGAPKLTESQKEKIEALKPGDEVAFVKKEVSEHGRMQSYSTVMLHLKLGRGASKAYLEPSQFRSEGPTLEAMAEHLEDLVFIVEEMIPQSERTARAKSPKLTIRVAMRD